MSAAKKKKTTTKTVEFDVVGMSHRVTMSTRKMIARKIEEAGPLACRLVREEDNLADENAIKVVISERPYAHLHIGYLPRAVAVEYAPALDGDEIEILNADLFSVTPEDGEGEILVKFRQPVKNTRKSRT